MHRDRAGSPIADRHVLQWITAGKGARVAGIVHKTDAEREYAYYRQSKVGKLDKALDEASARNWAVVDMKRDWNRVFPGEPGIADPDFRNGLVPGFTRGDLPGTVAGAAAFLTQRGSP